MDSFQRTVAYIKPQPTTVWGLKYFPNMEPEIHNDQDSPAWYPNAQIEVSACNMAVVRDVVSSMGSNLKTMLEIGIARPGNGEASMSNILMREKPADSVYVGVDIDDRSYLDDASKNLWTIRANSHSQNTIRGFLADKQVSQIDLLFIDGWHSVNTCVNDWMFADMLSPNGVVLLHDTNGHPGCVGLFDAVDEALFDKQRFCTENDNGIAVFRRK